MKFPTLLFPFALCALPLLHGCASSPSGGVTVNAPNRLELTLTLDKTIDPNAYYGIALDDQPNDGAGPRALESATQAPNGVMGGNWRVFVRFHQNLSNPTVYYRTDPTDYRTERQLLGTSILFSAPRVGATSINFILNLDAQVSSGVYYFAHTAGATPTLAVDNFDINYVATNTVIVGDGKTGDTRIKPVDAYEDEQTSTFFTYQISSTRRSTITDPQGDVNFGVDPSFSDVNFGQIDVRQLDLSVTRGS